MTRLATPADRRDRIEARLREALGATYVEVTDDTEEHAGHAGARGGQSHYSVTVVSPRFSGLSRVGAQRLVYEALTEELVSGLHALALRTFTPEQWRGGA